MPNFEKKIPDDEVDDNDLSIPNGSDEQRRWNVGENTHISKGAIPVKDDFTGMMVTKGNRPKILKEEDLENPVALYMQSMENKEKCTVKVILDSGANTMVTPHTNILWDRTSTSKVIGTAGGEEIVPGSSGGVRLRVGKVPLDISSGVYSDRKFPHTLLGTNILGLAGLTSIFHKNEVFVMKEDDLVINESKIVCRGKVDPVTDLPMINLEACIQDLEKKEGMSEEELRKRYLSKRKRDIALYTNAMNRKKCVSVVETMNSLPTFMSL